MLIFFSNSLTVLFNDSIIVFISFISDWDFSVTDLHGMLFKQHDLALIFSFQLSAYQSLLFYQTDNQIYLSNWV